MAYNWNWDNKSGEIFYDKWHYDFYKGNGFMIAIEEFKMTPERLTVDDEAEDVGKDMYRVAWFMIDKDHAKRCLGLVKGSYDMFEGNVDKIIIYKDHCDNWKDIVELFTKTQPNITIEIKPTEKKEEKQND